MELTQLKIAATSLNCSKLIISQNLSNVKMKKISFFLTIWIIYIIMH